jgi:hypothetical protein
MIAESMMMRRLRVNLVYWINIIWVTVDMDLASVY